MIDDGQTSQSRMTRTYEEIKARAAEVSDLFKRQGIPVHPKSAIGVLLKDAELLEAKYRAGESDATAFSALFNAAHMERVASALLMLEHEPNCDTYLKKLTSTSLDFLDRNPSHAKDIFWEIELWWTLKRASADAKLVDPPDIILNTPDGPLAIPCKKIYSEKNVARQLNSAVKQLKQFDGVGIAAINIDDLAPERSILSSPTAGRMGQFIDTQNVNFMERFRVPIQRYFDAGRLSAIAVCTTVLAEVTEEGTRLNNARQMTIWAWPDVPPVVKKKLEYFARVMRASINGVELD